MSMQRLRTDFRFAIVMLFVIIAILGIAPFAGYRFLQGQVLAGCIDSAIVLCICAGAVHAWRGGDLEVTTVVVMAMLAIGCVAATEVMGLPGLFWTYPLAIGSFLVVSRGKALAIVLAAIGVVALRGAAFGDHLQAFVFVVTALVTSLFAFIFAQRSEGQHRQLENLAQHDALTGALNRLTMPRRLQAALEDAEAKGAPVALALVDLDHFKRVNDVAGHEAGDRILTGFAALVREHARAGDSFFRTGGEEFLLLAPATTATMLAGQIEGLRAAAATQLACEGVPVTISAGVAALRPGDGVRAWLRHADEAMYRAKDGGRNRVEVGAP